MSIMQKWKKPLLVAGLLTAPVAFSAPTAQASDHGDTAENVKRIGADLTDLYIFPSPQNSNNVVLAMNVVSLIPAGLAQFRTFDPTVLYQFKIDNTGDAVEDLVIQAKFQGTGQQQRVFITGPVRPTRTGNTSVFQTPNTTNGLVNRTFSPMDGMQVFAGAREDTFFFDLERFYQIFPDRVSPFRGARRDNDINTPNPNTPRVNGWRPPGQARDFFRGVNVMSIVVELPKSSLRSAANDNGQIGVWMTTSVGGTAGGTANNSVFVQQERLARPAINEVLATVSNNRHRTNNRAVPTQDSAQLANDIRSFFRFPAGRSEAITNVAVAVLVPDVMKADLTQAGPAAFLGVETGGATGGRFGGRAIRDDIVDIELGVIFGNTIPALGLAPDDGNELPQFTTDNVGSQNNDTNTFPYLPAPA